MNTEVETVEAETPATAAPRASAALRLLLTCEGEEPRQVLKYPMPVRAPQISVMINDEPCVVALTTFKDVKYAYFTINEVGFYVKGHLDAERSYSIAFPEGYAFVPVKVDRQAQAQAAKIKAAAKKALAASGDASPASEGPAEAPNEAVEAPEGKASAAPAKKGRKAVR